MTETNPYAPPKSAEVEASSLPSWYCYGERVVAKNGAALPKIDLETGVSDGELTAVSRVYQPAGAGQAFRVFLLIAVYMIAKNVLHTDASWLLWAVIGGSIVVNGLLRLRGNVGGTVTILEYREAPREHRRTIRRKLRGGMLFLSLAMIIGGPLLISPSYPADLYLLFGGIGLLFARTVWAALDRPQTRSEAGPAGALRIRNIHPQAMVKLRKIEAEEREKTADATLSRKREVFTCFYHKFPLASLLGDGQKNPFMILVVALMKVLRSKRLERESFDFTEATEIREDELNESLRARIGAWLTMHPDWTPLLMEKLPSPVGDLTIETVLLASPGFEHAASFHHSWLERKPTGGVSEFSFLTWLIDGKILCTTHMPLLQIERPDVDAVRVKGTAEEVFQAHLARCGGREISPATGQAELRERFQQERRDASALLEAAGLRGPIREIG